jgi:uncharacterized protein (TIGR02145 family)
MKNLNHLPIIAGIFLTSSIFFSQCQEEKEKETEAQEQEISFTVSSMATHLKSGSIYQLNKAKKIVLTIKTSDNTSTIYTSSKIDLYQLNGEFYSQKLALKVGSYQITEFFLLDSLDNPIFAVPMKDSPGDQDVNWPLPIIFNLTANNSTLINIEVVSTENKPLEYFGFVKFSISTRNGLPFMIAATDLASGDLLSAKLTVYNNENKKTQLNFAMEAIANNTFTIDTTRFKCSEQLLIVSKYGYEPYSHVFTWEELLKYLKTPLVIELRKAKYESCDPIEDYDGNSYLTVRIGDQCWMAENLRTTHYADGTPIPQPTAAEIWTWDNPGAITKGMYKNQFYSWSAAMNDATGSTTNPSEVQGACPAEWHIPSDAEWIQMRDYLIANGYGYGGSGTDIAKSLASTSEWDPVIVEDFYFLQELLNNTTGFAGRPLSLYINTNYEGYGWSALWWSATEDKTVPYYRVSTWEIGGNTLELRKFKRSEILLINVRCVKD